MYERITKYHTEAIKAAIPVPTAFEYYTLSRPDEKGFVCCPFHAEKTASMILHDTYYHCFGCGAGGDVITLAKNYFGLSFHEAVKKLNEDFGVGLFGTEGQGISEKIKAASRVKRIEKERARKASLKEADFMMYLYFTDKLEKLEENRKKYAPKRGDDALHPLYAEAVSEIPRVLSMWDEWDAKLKEVN